jgi:PKD repeat protein
VVEFSVDFWIQDSTSNNYDIFRFEVWNRSGEYLGCIEFDNEILAILRGDGSDLINTGVEYKNGVPYFLSATINLEQKTWSAYLDDQILFVDQPITQTQRVVDLGSIDVVWQIRQQADPGDNFIVFDNYRISRSKGVPLITSPGQRQTSVGEDFDYQIEATQSPGGYDAIGLPDGLLCNTTGRISGKPVSPGTSQVTLTANNSVGTGTKLLLLTVEADELQVPVITSAPTASAKAGSPFGYQISATNAPTSYNASLHGGGLPSGLSIATDTGLLSGTPTASGTYSIIISATNSGGTGEVTLTLVVDEPTPSPSPEPSPSPSPSPQAGPAQGGATTGGSAPQAQKSKKGSNKGKTSSAKKSGRGSSKKASASKSPGGKKSGAKKPKKK